MQDASPEQRQSPRASHVACCIGGAALLAAGAIWAPWAALFSAIFHVFCWIINASFMHGSLFLWIVLTVAGSIFCLHRHGAMGKAKVDAANIVVVLAISLIISVFSGLTQRLDANEIKLAIDTPGWVGYADGKLGRHSDGWTLKQVDKNSLLIEYRLGYIACNKLVSDLHENPDINALNVKINGTRITSRTSDLESPCSHVLGNAVEVEMVPVWIGLAAVRIEN